MDRLLGPGHRRITDSGDSVADREAAKAFVAEFDRKHRIDVSGDQALLSTGETDWPMPIPLVRHAGGWAFDADAGEEELIARRIGRNELDAMQVCLAFVDMQLEYAASDHNGDGLLEYATRLVSRPGRRDGLYWPAQAGQPQSPAGPRLAAANVQPTAGKQSSKPFHGYTSASSPRRASMRRVRRRDPRRRPADRRRRAAGPARQLPGLGREDLPVPPDGAIFERDLGPETATLVRSIKAFDPGPGWSRAK